MPCLRKGKKKHDVTWKPFVGTRGFKSHPVELSQQPERVLRRGAVTIPAKRRQLVQKPCESASKAPFSEPSFWIRRGPCRRHRDGHGDVGLCGVHEQGRCIVGFLRNVGSPVVSRGNSARGKPIPNSRPTRRVPWPVGSEKRGTPTGIANRRKRRAAKGMAGWLSVLVVPMKRGNSNPRGPRGGKEKPEGDARLWTRWKET